MQTKWQKSPKGEGIVVAADETVEWLLPWWFAKLRLQNTLPVCFVDLGLSYYGRSFCEKRGEMIQLSCSLPEVFVPHTKEWEILFGSDIKKRRENWYKKPFAFLLTPFEKTLWLDVDCEVLKSLDGLFVRSGDIHLACESPTTHLREQHLQTIEEGEILYNSGVILYHHGSPLIEKWAEAVLKKKEQFLSDQHVLSHLIKDISYPIHPLEAEYNWRMAWGLNIHAAIVHWVGSWGKEFIRRYGGIGEELCALPPI